MKPGDRVRVIYVDAEDLDAGILPGDTGTMGYTITEGVYQTFIAVKLDKLTPICMFRKFQLELDDTAILQHEQECAMETDPIIERGF